MAPVKILCWGNTQNLFAGRNSILCRDDCEVLLASSMREVLHLAQRARPSVVLVDRDLAGPDCAPLCRKLRSGRRTSEIPLILMSSETALDPGDERIDATEVLRRPGPHEISQALARAIGLTARKYPRFGVEAPARVRMEKEAEFDSRALDISLEGVQLEIDQPLQLGSEVSVSLSLPVDRTPLALRATVVRILADPIWGRNRLGLQFLRPDDRTRQRLQTLLARLAEAQEKLLPPEPDEPQNQYLF